MAKRTSSQETNSVSPSGKTNQRRHNRATKGNNTRKKLPEIDWTEVKLRWEEELAFFIAMNRYKVYKEKLPSGIFEYRVLDEYGHSVLTIESARNVMFSPRRRKRKRRR
jgi:hypothetical protein